MMEEQFRAILAANAGVAAIVPLARINFYTHPQGASLPAMVLNVISGAEGVTLTGRDGLERGRVQVDCYATTYSGAKTLGRAAHDAMHAYSGGGFSLIEGVAMGDFREGGSNEAERPYRFRLDFNTHWRSA